MIKRSNNTKPGKSSLAKVFLILFSLICLFITGISVVSADDAVYSTVGGTWVKVNEKTWTMDKDGDGKTDVTLIKEGDEWRYIFNVADDSSMYYGWETDIPDGYHVENGYGTKENPAVSIQYAHTPNIDNDGVQNGNYTGGVDTNKVFSVPGSSTIMMKLTADLAVGDYLVIWTGSHPDYTAAGDTANGTKTGTVVFDESGKTSFNLKNGESIFIKDIPAGTEYTIIEDVATGYTEANDGKYTGTIKKGDTQSVNVVNTYNPSHKMTIKKIVKGNQGDKTKQFKFQIMLTGNGVPGSLAYTKNGQAGSVTVKNGIAEFTLGHEDVMVFNEMPAGVKYVITELDGESNGYAVESKNASGTTDKDVEVSFTNTKNVGVPTAAMTNTGAIAGVIMAGVIGIMIAVIAKRKKRRNEK